MKVHSSKKLSAWLPRCCMETNETKGVILLERWYPWQSERLFFSYWRTEIQVLIYTHKPKGTSTAATILAKRPSPPTAYLRHKLEETRNFPTIASSESEKIYPETYCIPALSTSPTPLESSQARSTPMSYSVVEGGCIQTSIELFVFFMVYTTFLLFLVKS